MCGTGVSLHIRFFSQDVQLVPEKRRAKLTPTMTGTTWRYKLNRISSTQNYTARVVTQPDPFMPPQSLLTVAGRVRQRLYCASTTGLVTVYIPAGPTRRSSALLTVSYRSIPKNGQLRSRLRCKMDHSIRRVGSRLAGVKSNFQDGNRPPSWIF